MLKFLIKLFTRMKPTYTWTGPSDEGFTYMYHKVWKRVRDSDGKVVGSVIQNREAGEFYARCWHGGDYTSLEKAKNCVERNTR